VLELTKVSQLPSDWPGSVVAIGKFDGIHLGHQQLIHEAVEYAQDASLAAIALTFDRHPKALFDPANCPKELIGPGQKADLISDLGVDALLVLEFDQALASLTPEDFVSQQLVPLGTQMVFVGVGFTFGAGGKGTVEQLRELGQRYGFRVREIANVLFSDHKVSSTDIRLLLEQGKVETAALLLGRNHRVIGTVEHGRKLGRTLGFPTANISRDADGLLPSDGVYAGWVYVGEKRYPAAHSVGTNDSIEAVPRLLESHLIGVSDIDLYGQVVTCEFVAQVRGWQKFSSLEDLVQQISDDVAKATEILGE
jgi:riboflavin kinase/FMN adenylyltransferase